MTETVVLMTAVVLALVATALYVQRGYQGYLLANALSHGLPYDPRQPNLVVRTLNLSQDQVITIEAGPSVGQPGCTSNLPSVPCDAVPGRTVTTTAKVTNDWDFCSRAAYGVGAALPAACSP